MAEQHWGNFNTRGRRERFGKGSVESYFILMNGDPGKGQFPLLFQGRNPENELEQPIIPMFTSRAAIDRYMNTVKGSPGVSIPNYVVRRVGEVGSVASLQKIKKQLNILFIIDPSYKDGRLIGMNVKEF